MKTEHRSIRLGLGVHKKAKIAAVIKGIPVGKWITQAILEKLKKQPNKETGIKEVKGNG